MIEIVMTNGTVVRWNETEFSEYKYDGKYFIIIKGEKWVGFYNLDRIISIVVK